MRSEKQKTFIFFAFLFSLLLATHFQLVVNDPTLTYDDWVIVGPLLKLGSFTQYFSLVSTGQILDLQPIRDLSHLIDIYLKSILPFYSFHLSNLLIWFFILISIFRLFENFKKPLDLKPATIFAFLALIAFSPYTTSSVAWISARKHLLSFAFILICTLELTSIEKDENHRINFKKILFFYLLSILSQPINLFWPCWALGYLKIRKYQNAEFVFVASIFLLMIAAATANWYYYSVFFTHIGKTKLLSHSILENVEHSLLALGRYFYLIINPTSALPSPHSKDSLENVIGLLMIFAFGMVLYFLKRKHLQNRSYWVIFIAYFFIHLLPVLYQSAIFVSDTYVLNAALGIYLIFMLLSRNHQRILYFILIYSIFLFYKNFQYVDVFKNSKSIWLYSFNKEQTTESTTEVAENMILDRRFEDAYAITKDSFNKSEFLPFYAKAVFLSKFSSLDKKKLLLNISTEHPAKYFFLLLLAADASDLQSVREFSEKLFLFDHFLNWVPIQKRNRVAELLKPICQRSFSSPEKCLSHVVAEENNQFPASEEMKMRLNNSKASESFESLYFEFIVNY